MPKTKQMLEKIVELNNIQEIVDRIISTVLSVTNL